MTPPRLVATIGLHASASTWVFNVVRELMIAGLGEAAVLGAYADTTAELPDEAMRVDRHLVVKSHHGSPELDQWLAAQKALIVLSVRDPRDACISMALRFQAPLDQAVRWIANDCNRLARLAERGHPLLRYEDRFFAHAVAAESLARILRLMVPEAMIKDIAMRYGTEAVRAFARALPDLPSERLTQIGTTHVMDKLTQIHGPHIGDARSGKWRGLPAPTQAELTRLFGPFLDRFAYPR